MENVAIVALCILGIVAIVFGLPFAARIRRDRTEIEVDCNRDRDH